MIKAPLFKNEKERLATLERYRILDTPPEKAFDEITWLVAYICETPIAYISIVDKERQWFKSKVGLTAEQTPRDIAFCAHAILETHTMIVSDALTDERFSDNPLVLEDPKIRFYAGTPLVSPEGFPLGTLCAVDRQPRTLNPRQLEALGALATQAESLLEYRRISLELREALSEIKMLSGLLPMCAWCKRIRDENDNWNNLERYIAEHSNADVTHGICPDCRKKHFEERKPIDKPPDFRSF
jgi:GAF domain-containing protein